MSLKKKNLFDTMRNMFSQYAMRFNKKYERKGHLFGSPYRQAVCFDVEYLLTASLYIHLNPVRANLKSDPVKYRWSSCRLYLKNSEPRSFINSDFILSMLSENGKEAKLHYKQLLMKGCGIETEHVLEKEDTIERFCLKLGSLFTDLFRKIRDENRLPKYFGVELIGLNELERQIQEMKGDARSRKPESLMGKKYLIEQLIARGFKRDEIAERLGISRKTVYNILKSSLPNNA